MWVALMLFIGIVAALLAIILSNFMAEFIKVNANRLVDNAFLTLLWLPFQALCFALVTHSGFSTRNSIIAYFTNFVVGYFIRGKNYKSQSRIKLQNKIASLTIRLTNKFKHLVNSKVK